MSALVVVAMSGGVDSCAAALLLSEAGNDIVGVSMQVWDYRKNGGNSSRATCCAPSDFDDAREIAESLGFPFYVFDFEDSFHDSVITPFIQAYQHGLTPNPCLDCNRKVKFEQLRNRGRALGAKAVATGHYAQIRAKDSGLLGLFTAKDTTKDQSYFLYALTQADLRQTLFPVGGMLKSEVRDYLRQRGFKVSSKAESQDICFVSGTVKSFIERETNAAAAPGVIVDNRGERVGTHDGIYQYTVGQRRGLGLSHPTPLYVLDIDSTTNTVRVGEKEELEQDGYAVGEVNWVSGEPPQHPIEARVKLRYRHPGVRCTLQPGIDSQGRAIVQARFSDEWTAVSPGQAAVFYALSPEDDGAIEVLGGGRILKHTAAG